MIPGLVIAMRVVLRDGPLTTGEILASLAAKNWGQVVENDLHEAVLDAPDVTFHDPVWSLDSHLPSDTSIRTSVVVTAYGEHLYARGADSRCSRQWLSRSPGSHVEDPSPAPMDHLPGSAGSGIPVASEVTYARDRPSDLTVAIDEEQAQPRTPLRLDPRRNRFNWPAILGRDPDVVLTEPGIWIWHDMRPVQIVSGQPVVVDRHGLLDDGIQSVAVIAVGSTLVEVSYVRWASGSAEVGCLRAEGGGQNLMRLVGSDPLGIYREGDSRFAELAMPDEGDGDSLLELTPHLDALDEILGSSLEDLLQQEYLGGTVTTRESWLGDEGPRRDKLIAAWHAEGPDVPLVVYAVTRVLPLIAMDDGLRRSCPVAHTPATDQRIDFAANPDFTRDQQRARDEIRSRRLALSVKIDQFAALLGISKDRLSLFERGELHDGPLLGLAFVALSSLEELAWGYSREQSGLGVLDIEYMCYCCDGVGWARAHEADAVKCPACGAAVVRLTRAR